MGSLAQAFGLIALLCDCRHSSATSVPFRLAWSRSWPRQQQYRVKRSEQCLFQETTLTMLSSLPNQIHRRSRIRQPALWFVIAHRQTLATPATPAIVRPPARQFAPAAVILSRLVKERICQPKVILCTGYGAPYVRPHDSRLKPSRTSRL